MYITVRLLNGFQKPLLYKLSSAEPEVTLIGSMVTVPLQKRFEPAIVVNTAEQLSYTPTFAIREVQAKDIKHIDEHYFTFIQKLSAYYITDVMHFARRIQHFVTQKKPSSLPTAGTEVTHTKKSHSLTPEQERVYTACARALTDQRFFPALIHGVTGSGKTEIYKKLLIDCITQNKSALFLVPEVTLALQFEQLLRTQLPSTISIISFHSATTARDKKYLWQAITTRKPLVIIGVHLPILLPIANLGLILVDEEHETGYQEKKHPKINTKEAALMRAQHYQIPIIMGSATPSITSLHNAKQKKYAFFQIKKRFAGNFPTIRVIPLNDPKQKKRPHFWISRELYSAIQDRLEHNEQCIIFLNRRGHSFFVQCKDCSFIFECKNCSVSLTLHDNNKLTCHYCGYKRSEPATCPTCNTDRKNFLKKGIGTQQLITILQKLFPKARIARADMDTTLKKKQWQQTVEQFSNRELDILVGTQTITKGYHFPGVTLVGIVWADLNLHMPFFNAQEVCLQQLIQVAGRAGRQSANSLVIAQTMSEHALFNYLDERTYLDFYAQEIAHRSELGYPPCKRLVAIEVKHSSENIVEHESYTLAQALRNHVRINNLDIQILGPAKPAVHKVKKTYTRVFYIKSNNIQACIKMYHTISQNKYKSSIFFTPNPLN